MTLSLAASSTRRLAREGVILTPQDQCFRGPTHQECGSTSTMGALALRLQNYVSRRPNHDVCSLEANDERSQSTRALPSGSRNIACVPLSDAVSGNSKETPLATRSSWNARMSSVATTMTRYMLGSKESDQVTSISELAERSGATSIQRIPSLHELSISNSKPRVST